MVGRRHEVVPSKDQPGFGSNHTNASIRCNSKRTGRKFVENGWFPLDFFRFEGANSQQATDLVTWYYQDVQPHYPGMLAAGERLLFLHITFI